MTSKNSALPPLERWKRIAQFVRLVAISSRVENIDAPLNVLLVGPPGDGKTAMLQRLEHLTYAQFLSDTTYMGLVSFLKSVKDDLRSALIVPDMGTLVARKPEVAKQTVATIASMIAEGVYDITVGKKIRRFDGVKASFLSAITEDDLAVYRNTLNQNAFLSRVFLIDFALSWKELRTMARKKWRGDRSLLQPLPFPYIKEFPKRTIRVPEARYYQVEEWWKSMKGEIGQRVFGFRTPDQLTGLLQASAYLNKRGTVQIADVRFLERWVWPLIIRQYPVPEQVK